MRIQQIIKIYSDTIGDFMKKIQPTILINYLVIYKRHDSHSYTNRLNITYS